MKVLLPTLFLIQFGILCISCNKEASPNPIPPITSAQKDTVLVYVNDQGANDEIHVYNFSTKVDKTIALGTMTHISGESIVWVNNDTVYLGKLTADNLFLKKKMYYSVSNYIEDVQLSPDESRISFTTKDKASGNSTTNIIDTFGNSLKTISNSPNRLNNGTSFSADNSKLYFSAITQDNIGLLLSYTLATNKFDTLMKYNNVTTIRNPVEVENRIYYIKYNVPTTKTEIASIVKSTTAEAILTTLSASQPAKLSTFRSTLKNRLIFTTDTYPSGFTYLLTNDVLSTLLNIRAAYPNIYVIKE